MQNINSFVYAVGVDDYHYSSSDFHDGTMPYIYGYVETIIGNLSTKVEREYEVYLYYHGCYSTNVKAANKDEALQIARRQISDMSEVEFLSAIEAQEVDYDVSVVKKWNYGKMYNTKYW